MTNIKYVFICLFIGFTLPSQAQVLFEGYYQILLKGDAIGYTIQRYENLAKEKQFKTTSFQRINLQGQVSTESIVTFSDQNLKPIRYEYTAIDNQTNRQITAVVEGLKLKVTEVKKGQTTQREVVIEPNLFFSQALLYGILKSEEGLKVGVQKKYRAIAEELGEVASGSYKITKLDLFRSKIRSFEIENQFQSNKFIIWVSESGEVIKILDPLIDLTVTLVPEAAQATQGQVLPTKILTTLFGQQPLGHINIANRASKKNEWPLADIEPVILNKETGVKPGKGIHTKGGP